MEKPRNEKLQRLEAINALTSTDWRPLCWRFGKNERVAYEEVRKQLNRANGSVLFRVVRNSDRDTN
jgi:hypothetical protein